MTTLSNCADADIFPCRHPLFRKFSGNRESAPWRQGKPLSRESPANQFRFPHQPPLLDAPMRKINTKFFVFLVITAALVSGAIFGLHQLQAGNISEALLWQASQAEKDGKLDRAAKYLGRYLEFAREDLDQREHLGTILSDPQLATTPQRRARARFVIEQVLAKDPQRHALRERLCQTLITGRTFDVAKEHLNYLEKNQPNSTEVAYLVGLWHESQNQVDRAIEAYRRSIKADAGKIEAYLHLVAILKQADFGKEARHTEEIERLVVAALAKAPHDASVLSLAAQHAQAKGDTGIALHYLEDGLKQNPHEPRLYLALARIHGQNGKRTEAIDKLQLGLQQVRKEQQYDLRWSLANLLLDDNGVEEARKVIAQLREVNPVSAEYLEARSEMSRGRWFEAAKQFERIRPGLKSVKELAFQLDLYLGTCYEQLEEPAMQLTAFQRASEADPTALAARRGMANAFWALGQTAEALQISQDLASRSKDPSDAAHHRVEHVRMLLQSAPHQNAKEWKKIEQELAAIEKTLAKSMDVALLRAELWFVQGNKNQAEDLLHETIKEHPDRFEPWMALISFAAGKDDRTQTKQLMKTAEARFKDKTEFRLAQIRFWSRFYDAEAESALKNLETELAKFTPREQSALMQAMAEAHYWAHKYADSTRVLERMLQLPLNAQDIRGRMQRLELAILQNDDARAQAVLSEIKQIEGDGSVDGSFGEAVRLIRLGQKKNKESLERARHLLTVAAAQRPNWHPVIQARAELDELQGRPDQAIANYRRAVDLGSRDPQAMKQLLILLSQAQRFDEVEQLLLRMQKQYGTTEEVVRYYVAHSYQRRDFKKAELLIKQIIASNSTNYRDHLWMGQILSTTGQSADDAEKALRKAVALAPEQPETWINLVRHLISIGQHSAAKTEIDNAAKTLPEDKKDLTLAQCSELFGFLKNAAEHYDTAIEKLPTSVQVYRAAADFHLRVGSYRAAEMLYRKVAERKIAATDDDVTAARRGLALALVKQNRPQKATEALQLVGIVLDDKGMLPDGKIAEGIDEQLIQAKVLGSLNHHKLRGKAITLLESLQQKNALAADDQFFLARLLMQQGNDSVGWARTRNLLKALTLQYPKNARYLSYAAQLHIQQKEFNDAEPIIVRLEAVERERKTTPGGFGSTELRAKLFEMRGLGSQAEKLLTDYAKQPEASPVRKLLLANLQGRLGNYLEAVDLCEEVRQAAPVYHKDNTAAANALALEATAAVVAILRLNKPSEALLTKHAQWQEQRKRVESQLREMIVKNAKDVPARLHLADLMELQHKYNEVEKLCREVLKENDANLVALNNLAWLLGQRAESAAEALTLIERAIDKYGSRPELLDTRAIVLLNLGDVEKSLRDLERVVNEAPTPTRLFHLSRAYERSRNTTSALAMLRQANEQGLTMQQLHPVEQAEYQRVTAELNKRQ
jgi:predicted Zn-dependent protease